METRRVGSLNVTVVGLGCNNFGMRLDEDATARVVSAALDAGINFFDTADMYGGSQSEVFLGRILARRRKDVVIATKFGMPVNGQGGGAGAAYIRKALEDSLRRLRTDYIDLYQLHRPDPKTPIAETMNALDELVRAGKVREIGCSNFTGGQLKASEEARRRGGARFVSVQNEYSLLHRDPERSVLPACERHKVEFLPYFPLASGLLTGKYRLGKPLPAGTRLASGWGHDLLNDHNLKIIENLIKFCAARGHTLLELAMSWLAGRPCVASVIAGATSPEQVKANAAAAGWLLSDAELSEVDAIVSERPEEAYS